MKSKFFKINYIFLSLALIFIPIFSFAQTTNTGNQGQGTTKGIVYECNNGAAGECTFNDLLNAVKHVVNWATIFAIQFSVIIIVYAGFNYMMSGDNPGKRREANDMLIKVLKGMAFILLAWVIVQLIVNGLQVTGIQNFLQ